MKKFILGFLRDEQGQDLLEYALIVAAIGQIGRASCRERV